MKSCFSRSLLVASQRGIAFLELAIILPMMLILIVGVVDLGRALITYHDLTRVVYEGARFGTTLADIEQCDTNVDPSCPFENLAPPCDIANPRQIQCMVQGRVDTLLNDIYNLDVNLENIRIQSDFVPFDATDPAPETTDNVWVTVRADYISFFPWVQIPMVSTSSGPYLRRSFTPNPPDCVGPGC